MFRRVARTLRNLTSHTCNINVLTSIEEMPEPKKTNYYKKIYVFKDTLLHTTLPTPALFELFLNRLPLMVNLRELRLRNVVFQTTQENTDRLMQIMCGLTKLEKIYIKYDFFDRALKFTRIPDTISNLVNLESFEASLIIPTNATNDTPPQVSENLFGLEKLKILRLAGLSMISPSIVRLINLTELYISNASRGITVLPDSIGALTKLKTLHLINNAGMTSLPNTIINCVQLKELVIYHCPITALPENIGDSRNLQILYVRDTNLSDLPNSFVNLRKLKRLELWNNRLPSYVLDRPGMSAIFRRLNYYSGMPDDFRLEGIANMIAPAGNAPAGNAPVAVAFEVHHAFDGIKFDDLRNIIVQNGEQVVEPMTPQEFYEWLKSKLPLFESGDEPGRTELSNNLEAIKHKLFDMPFATATKKWGTYVATNFIRDITNFIDNQSEQYIKNYVRSYIKDNIGAYPTGYSNTSTAPNNSSSSCVNGMFERILLNLRSAGEGLDQRKYHIISQIISGVPVDPCDDVDTNDAVDFGEIELEEIPNQKNTIIQKGMLNLFASACFKKLKPELSEIQGEDREERRFLMMEKCILNKLAGTSDRHIRLPKGGIDELERAEYEQYIPQSVQEYLDANRYIFTSDDYLEGGYRRTTKKRRARKTKKQIRKRIFHSKTVTKK